MNVVGRHFRSLDDGRVRCEVCPRFCALNDGQRGMCFVRRREGDDIVLTTYGRSSGFVVDPIEKKPLNHFFPGSNVLSFGTAGCNLACKFCQNWDISKSREMDTLQSEATPDAIAQTCVDHGVKSVAFTYNDPVIFLEYAVDTAKACRERGIHTVAVTAGYLTEVARPDFFSDMDAANVDLKAFSESFYRQVTASELQPVLDTLRFLRHETDVWFEVTTLLIPGLNDSDDELSRQADWMLENLGPEVPLHFSAYHPDYKMDRPATPPSTLTRARNIARAAGLSFVYTGNVHDAEGDTTFCPSCDAAVIRRDWYEVLEYALDERGACASCGARIAGRFGAEAGTWGRRRLRVVPA